MEKHYAMLDASTSEIKIDVPELLSARKQIPVPFEELNIDATEGFKQEYLRYAKINEPQEAKSLVEYKLKYVYPDKQCFLAVPHLVNVPIWEFKLKDKKIEIFGNDENYKKTVLNALEKMYPKKAKSQSQLFAETISDITKPKNILKEFWTVVKTTNKWLLIIVLIMIITIIYYIIKNIITKIKPI